MPEGRDKCKSRQMDRTQKFEKKTFLIVYLYCLKNLWYPSACLPSNHLPISFGRMLVAVIFIVLVTCYFHPLYNICTRYRSTSLGDIHYTFIIHRKTLSRGRLRFAIVCEWSQRSQKLGMNIGQMRWARALVWWFGSQVSYNLTQFSSKQHVVQQRSFCKAGVKLKGD